MATKFPYLNPIEMVWHGWVCRVMETQTSAQDLQKLLQDGWKYIGTVSFKEVDTDSRVPPDAYAEHHGCAGRSVSPGARHLHQLYRVGNQGSEEQ